ncbi:FecR family protein [Dyadobacter soli]|uniref:FecR family protein n=2 Tax=Dyadobacter soli TaxID=659014 RepID=A0A1G7G1H3_9BACT|nr:FecR family protein [Dyadobacter soli]
MRITPELLQKYHDGLCTEAESREVEQWLAATDDLDGYAQQGDEEAAISEIWQKLDLQERHHPKPPRIAWLYPLLAAAAACLLLVASWNYFRHPATQPGSIAVVGKKIEYRYLQTADGERKRFLLPDSTVVYLNAGSRLTYPAGFSDTARVAWLTGEGYFEVAKDSTRPFTIHTASTRTTVLGTAFNLKSYPGSNVTLVVSEGKVRFASKTAGTAPLILTANERGIYDLREDRLAQDRVYARGHYGWVHDKLAFDNQPLSDIAPVLERWYGIKVVITAPELAARRCTGSFVNPSLENLMGSLAYSLNIKYKIENKNLTIY